MTTKDPTTNDEAEIRQVITDWLGKVCAKDVDRLMYHYATDVTAFNVRPPSQIKGAAAWRSVWEEGVSYFPSSFQAEMRDLSIIVSGDLALAHWLYRFTGMEEHHPATRTWMRATVGYKRQQGRWQIVHEHESFPFDPHSNDNDRDG